MEDDDGAKTTYTDFNNKIDFTESMKCLSKNQSETTVFQPAFLDIQIEQQEPPSVI